MAPAHRRKKPSAIEKGLSYDDIIKLYIFKSRSAALGAFSINVFIFYLIITLEYSFNDDTLIIFN